MTLDDTLADDEDASYWPGYVDALTNIVLNLLFMVGVFAVGVFAVSLESNLHRQRGAHLARAESLAHEAPQPATPPAPASRERPAAALERAATRASRAASDPAASTAPGARLTPPPGTASPGVPSPGSVPTTREPSATSPVTGTTIVRVPPPIEIEAERGPEHAVQMKFTDSRGNPLAQLIFPGDRFALATPEEERLATWVREQQAAGTRTFMLFTSVDESDAQDRRAGYLRVMAARSTLLRTGVPAAAISTRMFRGEQRELAGNRQITILPNPRDN